MQLIGLSVVIIGISLILAHISSERARAGSPILAFVLVSILFNNIGFMKFYTEYARESWAETALMVSSVGLLTVAVGGLIGVRFQKMKLPWPVTAQGPSISVMSYDQAVAVSLVVFGTTLLYFYLLGYIPLIEGIKTFFDRGFVPGLVNSFRVRRDIYINPEANYIPLQGLLESIRYFGLPVVAVWFVHYYRIGLHRTFSAVMVLLSLLLITLTGQRWPLMYMLLTILVYLSWTLVDTRRYHATLLKVSLAAVFLGTVLSGLLGRTSSKGLSVLDMMIFGIRDLLNRILVGNARTPFLSYRIFGHEHPFLFGDSWIQNLLAYLPGPSPSFPVTFYRLVTGDTKGFTAPPDFYTEAYINFGWPGLLTISLVWGLFLSVVQRIVYMNRHSLLRLSVLAMFTVLVAFSAISGITFLLGGLIVGVFIAALSLSIRTLFEGRRVDYLRQILVRFARMGKGTSR